MNKLNLIPRNPLLGFLKKGNKIHIKKSNEGKFTEYCGGNVTQECIDKGKHSSDPKIRKRATFADNARKWKHAKGGYIKFAATGTTASVPTFSSSLHNQDDDVFKRQQATLNAGMSELEESEKRKKEAALERERKAKEAVEIGSKVGDMFGQAMGAGMNAIAQNKADKAGEEFNNLGVDDEARAKMASDPNYTQYDAARDSYYRLHPDEKPDPSIAGMNPDDPFFSLYGDRFGKNGNYTKGIGMQARQFFDQNQAIKNQLVLATLQLAQLQANLISAITTAMQGGNLTGTSTTNTATNGTVTTTGLQADGTININPNDLPPELLALLQQAGVQIPGVLKGKHGKKLIKKNKLNKTFSVLDPTGIINPKTLKLK